MGDQRITCSRLSKERSRRREKRPVAARGNAFALSPNPGGRLGPDQFWRRAQRDGLRRGLAAATRRGRARALFLLPSSSDPFSAADRRVLFSCVRLHLAAGTGLFLMNPRWAATTTLTTLRLRTATRCFADREPSRHAADKQPASQKNSQRQSHEPIFSIGLGCFKRTSANLTGAVRRPGLTEARRPGKNLPTETMFSGSFCPAENSGFAQSYAERFPILYDTCGAVAKWPKATDCKSVISPVRIRAAPLA